MDARHIPRGWRKVSLRNLAAIQTGLAKGKKNVPNPVTRPYLRVANVQDGRLDLSEIKEITVSADDLNRYSLQEGDVLMTEGGDFDKLGRGFVWQNEIAGCLHQNHVFVVRPDTSRLDPYFLAYQTASMYGKRYFLTCSKQSTNLASINSTQLKEYPVLVPPVQEQRSIVRMISVWDSGIYLTENLIAAAREQRNGLMQKLLVERRRLGGSSKSWGNVEFGSVFVESKERNVDSAIRLPITVGKYAIRKQDEHFKRNVASKDVGNYYVIRKGDFVYDPMSAYYGAFGRYDLDQVGIVSPAYRVLKLKEGFDSDFIRHVIKSHRILFQLEAKSSQNNRSGKRRLIQREEFASIEFSCPPLDEQKAIAAVLNLADHELSLLERQLAEFREQKRGLMQQLLTGKKRVSAAGAAA